MIKLKAKIVNNKAKGRISKRVFQEIKARQIFRKTNVLYPLIRTRTCACQGVKNVRFSENWACFVFLKHPFWDSPFCLVTDELSFFTLNQFFTYKSRSTQIRQSQIPNWVWWSRIFRIEFDRSFTF